MIVASCSSARYAPTDQQIQSAYDELLERTGCSDLEALRKLPSRTLNNASATINWKKFSYGYPSWMPVIDGLFIPDVPSTVYDRGGIADVPLMMGVTLDEGTIFAEWANKVTSDDELIRGILIYQGKETAGLAPNLIELYKDDVDVSPFRPELYGKPADENYFGAQSKFRRAAAIFGDYTFHAPMRSMLRATARKDRKSSTWAYLFAQPSTEFYRDGMEWKGIPHGSEIPYVYNNPGEPNASPSTAEQQYCSAAAIEEVAEFMSRAWINFAYHLDPNEPGAEKSWPSHREGGRLMYIQGGNMTTIGDDYRKEQVDFFLQHKDVYRM